MVEPNTSNIGLIVPNDGDLPGTWGSAAINPDMVAIDGLFGGVTTVSLSSSPVTLTAPSGTISAAAGPTQSQNAIIKLTGVLTANVQVTLPLPGAQRIHNLTTGNFVVTLKAAGSGAVVGIPQGKITNVYNDGSNVYLMLADEIGGIAHWTGYSAMPGWVAACTSAPYLLADGSVYNISAYPYLGALYGSKFGGNGLTTFAVPDLSGRVPLQYDFTGTRITTAGSGVNGQSIGSAGGAQNATILQANLPAVTLATSIPAGQGAHAHVQDGDNGSIQNAGTVTGVGNVSVNNKFTGTSTLPAMTGNTPLGGSGTPTKTLSPAQVTGIWAVRAA